MYFLCDCIGEIHLVRKNHTIFFKFSFFSQSDTSTPNNLALTFFFSLSFPFPFFFSSHSLGDFNALYTEKKKLSSSVKVKEEEKSFGWITRFFCFSYSPIMQKDPPSASIQNRLRKSMKILLANRTSEFFAMCSLTRNNYTLIGSQIESPYFHFS